MAYLAQFCGGFYQALSPLASADTAVNIYTETREVPGSAKQVTLYGTPGLVLDGTVGTSGNRGWFTQDGRTWTVIGGTLYERTAGPIYTPIGLIAEDGNPVTFASNGRGGEQLGIVGGGHLYVLGLLTGVLTDVPLPFSNPVMITFIDGYALINERDSPLVWFSALEDMTSWDALDFFARSNTSDNIVAIGVSRDRVWGFGSKNLTLFYNGGDADTPFVPYPGTTVQIGLISPWLLTLYNDQFVWASTSARGVRKIVTASDPQPVQISTPPIDLFLAGVTTLDGARVLAYEQEGHTFVAFTFPGSPDDIQTYCFDLKEQFWHARDDWDAALGRSLPWRCAGSTSVDGQVLVGDATNGNIYELDLNTFTNNGDILRRERTTPYLAVENQWLFLDQFELGIQAGEGLTIGQGAAPVADLEISRDGSRTWVSAGTATLGAIGRYLDRAIWRRLGRSRSDRLVIRVTKTDPTKTAWTGAWLRTTPGSGQL